MLARRLVPILPAMRLAAALETTRIHHVAGLTGGRTAVVTTLPFWTHPTPSPMSA
jgi:magnesium chelatase family protein